MNALFLRRELAPSAERTRSFARLLIEIAFLITFFAALDIEFLELSLVIVFLIGAKPPEEGPRPYLLLGAAGTAAVALILPYYALTYNSPALRTGIAFGAAFASIWVSHISPRLRSTGIIAAVVFVYAQSFFDKIPDAELACRACAYVWRALVITLAALAAADALILPPGVKPAEEPPLEKDAFTNPRYLGDAFRSTLAGFICYVFYCGADWFAAHTCMITCFVLALPSREDASRKAALRVTGSLTGGAITLIAALALFPRLDSIAGVLAMSLACLAPAAWVAAGSARIHYAGCQMALMYILTICNNYMFYLDMAEIGGRTLGVLIGTAVSGLLTRRGAAGGARAF